MCDGAPNCARARAVDVVNDVVDCSPMAEESFRIIGYWAICGSISEGVSVSFVPLNERFGLYCRA